MNNNDFTKSYVNSKPTKLVGFGFNQNPDKLGRQTVEEVRENRIRFNQKLENERFFKPRQENNEIDKENNPVEKRSFLSSLKNLNKK